MHGEDSLKAKLQQAEAECERSHFVTSIQTSLLSFAFDRFSQAGAMKGERQTGLDPGLAIVRYLWNYTAAASPLRVTEKGRAQPHDNESPHLGTQKHP
jgi:hypothetical protein